MALDEPTFLRLADRTIGDLARAFDDFDPDEVEADHAPGVLTLRLSDETKILVNRQGAARQIWVAAPTGGFHFSFDEKTAEWREDKTGAELRSHLAELLSGRLRRTVEL